MLPAEDVELEITADPNSLVNVLAVDKSILLIGTGNDITVENVRNYIFHGNKRFVTKLNETSEKVADV